jgi:hypothetical protein
MCEGMRTFTWPQEGYCCRDCDESRNGEDEEGKELALCCVRLLLAWCRAETCLLIVVVVGSRHGGMLCTWGRLTKWLENDGRKVDVIRRVGAYVVGEGEVS